LVKRESRQDRMGPEIRGRPPEADRCNERGDPQEYRTDIEGRGGDIGTDASTCGCALTTRRVEGHVAGAVARRETCGRAFRRGQRRDPRRTVTLAEPKATRPVGGQVAGAVARRETYGRAFGRGQRPAPNR
jgi:hypothetical protein